MIVLLYIFITAAAIQVIYYLVVFSRLALLKLNNATAVFNEPVSIVICAKDEAINLEKFLPTILTQNHFPYEVVVVNDRSSDDTHTVLAHLQSLYPHLSVVHIGGEKILAGKRDALLKGVQMARYENILVTDADCSPEGQDWIAKMAARFDNPETKIVLGYGAYEKKDGWLNKMIHYDTFLTALQYFSFAIAGAPYMGVGRNLAYKKSLFLEYNNFEHQTTIGGDDDLFVNAVANSHNTDYCLNAGAATLSIPKTTWKQWIGQKWRHSNAGHQYRLLHRIMLGGFLVSMVVFNLCWPLLILNYDESHLWITVLILKTVLQLVIYKKCMNKLRVSELWVATPVLDFCMSYFLISLSILSLIKKPEWTK